MAQIGESAIGGSLVFRDAYPRVARKLNLWLVAVEARPKIAGKRGARNEIQPSA